MKTTANQSFRSITLLLGVALFITSGCQKRSFEELNPKGGDEESVQLGTTQEDQPLDYLGEQHSHCLDYLGQKNAIDTNKSTIHDKATKYLDDSLQGNHFLSLQNSKNRLDNYIYDTAETKQAYIDLSFDYLFNYLKSNGTFNSEVESYFKDIKNDFANFTDHATLTNELESLERTVQNDTLLSSDEEDLILGALAVARHNVTYWDDVRNQSSHDWHSDYVNGLSGNEGKDLMLNLGYSSAVTFGLVYQDAKSNGYGKDNRFTAALGQIGFYPGPIITDDISP